MHREENSLDRLLGRKAQSLPQRDKSGRLIYEAFDPKDKSKILEIRTAKGVHRAPAYAYLLDVISDGDKGEAVTLLYSFMVVDIKGRNLQLFARALMKRECGFIQEFDGEKFTPPATSDAVIESMEITASD